MMQRNSLTSALMRPQLGGVGNGLAPSNSTNQLSLTAPDDPFAFEGKQEMTTSSSPGKFGLARSGLETTRHSFGHKNMLGRGSSKLNESINFGLAKPAMHSIPEDED